MSAPPAQDTAHARGMAAPALGSWIEFGAKLALMLLKVHLSHQICWLI